MSTPVEALYADWMNASPALQSPAHLPRVAALATLMLVALVVACVDSLTSHRLSLWVLFAPIAAACAWQFGLATAVCFSLAASLVTLLDDYAAAAAPTPEAYAAAVVRFIVFAGFSWVFVRLRRTRDELRRLAAHDALTGLASRQELFVVGERELQRARREGQPLGALYIDCDHFKAVNDRWGHSRGDELLREVGESIRAVFGDAFVKARLGGDEFVVIARSIDRGALRESAERLEADFARRMAARGDTLTLSIGAAWFLRPPASLDQVLATADELMYAVKLRTRNAVGFEAFDSDRGMAARHK